MAFKADYMGMFTSILCAIHCSAVPVFMSLGLVSGAGHSHNHFIDLTLALTGLVIALYTLVKDYNFHKNIAPLAIASIGFVVLFGSILYLENIALNILGGLSIAYAHYLNIRQERVCRA